jgi:hypothetical protein
VRYGLRVFGSDEGLDTRIIGCFWGCARRNKLRGLAAGERKADQSFRLRLHSGLRQCGSACGAAFIGVAKATPYQSGPAEAGPFRGLAVDAGVRGYAEVRSHSEASRGHLAYLMARKFRLRLSLLTKC